MFLRKMSKQLGEAAGNSKWYEMSERLIPIMKDTKNAEGKAKNLNQRRFLLGQRILHHGDPARFVYADFRNRPCDGMVGTRHGAARKQSHHPAHRRLHWADRQQDHANRSAKVAMSHSRSRLLRRRSLSRAPRCCR